MVRRVIDLFYLFLVTFPQHGCRFFFVCTYSATTKKGRLLSLRVHPGHTAARAMPQCKFAGLFVYRDFLTTLSLRAIGDRATQQSVPQGFIFVPVPSNALNIETTSLPPVSNPGAVALRMNSCWKR